MIATPVYSCRRDIECLFRMDELHTPLLIETQIDLPVIGGGFYIDDSETGHVIHRQAEKPLAPYSSFPTQQTYSKTPIFSKNRVCLALLSAK